MIDQPSDEERIQCLVRELRDSLESGENTNLALGSDPIWNEAVYRAKRQFFESFIPQVKDPESLAAIHEAIKLLDTQKAG